MTAIEIADGDTLSRAQQYFFWFTHYLGIVPLNV